MMMRKLTIVMLVVVMAVMGGRALAQSPNQSVPIVVGVDVYERATAASEAEDYEQALVEWSLFIYLNPTFSEGYYQRARTYTLLENFPAAIPDLTQALELPSPSTEYTVEVLNIRAAVYMELQEMEAALADYNQAIELAPDSPNAYFRRGQYLMGQGELEAALADMNEVVRTAPDFPDTYYLRGVLNGALNNLDAAVEDFSRRIELAPNDGATFAERSTIYVRQEKYEEALLDLNKALELTPSDIGLYLRRGMVLNELGRRAEAAADYFEWMRNQTSDVDDSIVLRPGESQVVEMETGKLYAMAFDGQMGQVVTVSATARESQPSDPLLVLTDSEITPLAADDDGGGNLDARISGYILPANGIYFVALGYAGGGSNGPVRVLLEVSDP